MFWQAGDSGEKLRDELKSYIEHWLGVSDWKSRLPRRHINVLKQGEVQPSGVSIVIMTEKDQDSSWIFRGKEGDDAGKAILEEKQMIAIVIRADQRSGGVSSVSPVHSALRSLFSCLEGMPEQADLVSRGIYNLFESTEGLQVNPGEDSGKGVFVEQQLNLVCDTDTRIN